MNGLGLEPGGPRRKKLGSGLFSYLCSTGNGEKGYEGQSQDYRSITRSQLSVSQLLDVFLLLDSWTESSSLVLAYAFEPHACEQALTLKGHKLQTRSLNPEPEASEPEAFERIAFEPQVQALNDMCLCIYIYI